MKNSFMRGMRSTRPRPISRIARSGAKSLENSRFSTSVVTPIWTVSKRRQLLVALQHVERADVVAEAVGLDDRFGKRRRVLEAEIEALAGDRVDAMGGVAGEREARRDEVARQRQAERPGARRSLHRDLAELQAEALLQFHLEHEVVARDQPVGVGRALRPDDARNGCPSSGRMANGPAGRKCSSARPSCGRSCATVQTMPDWP